MQAIPDLEKFQNKKQYFYSPKQRINNDSKPQFQDALIPISQNFKVGPRLTIKYEVTENEVNLEQQLPKSLYDSLYEFQKEGVRSGLRCFGRLLIGDEMGVGKTIQALSIAYVYKQHWPLLIICPSLLMLNWKDEALKWIEGLIVEDIQVIFKQKDDINPKAKIIIASYDLAVHHADQFEEIKIVIADEAHHLKSFASKRSLTLVPLLKQMRHVLLLTGTPALAKPREIYNLIQIIRPDVFHNFREFGNRYCDPLASRYKQGLDYNGCTNPIELHQILSHSIMIRRLKRDVLDQLPSKIRQNIKIQVDKVLKKQIAGIISQNTNIINSMGGGLADTQDEVTFERVASSASSQAVVAKCYKMTGLSKVVGVCEYLDEVVDVSSDQKFIIYAHHIEVLDKIEQSIQKNKWQYMRIDGSVSLIERHSNVQQFQTDPKVKIALLSITAASIGLTLTAASTVIFAEMHWTPGVMQQAEDRAHRIGQKSCVNCIYLLGEGTLDDRIVQINQTKIKHLNYFIDGGLRLHYKEETYQQEVWTPQKKTSQQYNDEIDQNNHQQFLPEKQGIKVRTIESFFPKIVKLEPPQSINKLLTSSELLEIESPHKISKIETPPKTQKQLQPEELQELLNFLDEVDAQTGDETSKDIFKAIQEQQELMNKIQKINNQN